MFTRKIPTKIILSVLFMVTFFSVTFISHAATTQYVPLAPVGNIPANTPVPPSEYITTLFQIGIGVAAGLAVLAIAYGGIKWMLSDVVTSKSNAIELIKNALLGLLLALSCYLILNTISPSLTNLSLLTDPVTGLDIKPAPANPVFNNVTGYRVTYYPTVYILRYQVNEYELTYISSDPGSPLHRRRYETLQSCENAVGTVNILSNTGFQCKMVQAYKHPGPPPGVLLGEVLNPNVTYDTQPPVTTPHNNKPSCETAKNALPVIYAILNDCGEGADNNNPTVRDFTGNTTQVYNECTAFVTLKRSEGFTILGEDACKPITS